MDELGADCIDLPEHDIDTGFISIIMRNEFKFGVDAYLHSMCNPSIPQSLQEIIEYNKHHSDIALKYGQNILLRDNKDGCITKPEYIEALSARESAINAFNTLFDVNKIDVFFMLAANSRIAAATGFLSMTIPISKMKNGLPIGSFFVARRYREDLLLRVTEVIESVLQ
jgi:amidase